MIKGNIPRLILAVMIYLPLLSVRGSDFSSFDLEFKDLVEKRRQMIGSLFGAQIRSLIYTPNGQGRVDLRKNKEKSYAIISIDPGNPQAPTLLIPLATIRFDGRNYSTPDWWAQNQEEIRSARSEGRPMPKQDPVEVQSWLDENDLSTNPWVYELFPEGAQVVRTKLNEYLLRSVYAPLVDPDGSIHFYRGAEKPEEPSFWESSRRPRWARYWTPDMTYAWRYARKAKGFLSDFLNDKTSILHFKMPFSQFEEGVRSGLIVLGAEWPKSFHSQLEGGRAYQDHLFGGQLYLGHPKWGVELEFRFSSQFDLAGRYIGVVTPTELIANRREALILSYERAQKQGVDLQQRFGEELTQRLRILDLEEALIGTAGVRQDLERVFEVFGEEDSSMSKRIWEVTNNDEISLEAMMRNHSRSICRKAVK